MMYAKITYTIDPSALPADPLALPPRRTAENTVAALAALPDERPARPWPDAVLDDPELALGDACPASMRGAGWWPVDDQSPALGLLEIHGPLSGTLDLVARRVIASAPIIAPDAVALAAEFDRIEVDLHRRIDVEAEARRLDFITAGDGQAATYDAKVTEAIAIDGGVTPSEAAHPFIWKEAAATGKTPAALAAEVLAKRSAWIVIGSDIEAARKGAKAAVTAAKGDKSAMQTAAVVDWAAIGGA